MASTRSPAVAQWCVMLCFSPGPSSCHFVLCCCLRPLVSFPLSLLLSHVVLFAHSVSFSLVYLGSVVGIWDPRKDAPHARGGINPAVIVQTTSTSDTHRGPFPLYVRQFVASAPRNGPFVWVWTSDSSWQPSTRELESLVPRFTEFTMRRCGLLPRPPCLAIPTPQNGLRREHCIAPRLCSSVVPPGLPCRTRARAPRWSPVLGLASLDAVLIIML